MVFMCVIFFSPIRTAVTLGQVQQLWDILVKTAGFCSLKNCEIRMILSNDPGICTLRRILYDSASETSSAFAACLHYSVCKGIFPSNLAQCLTQNIVLWIFVEYRKK